MHTCLFPQTHILEGMISYIQKKTHGEPAAGIKSHETSIE
jgi:hypothetical protein